ncbi:class I SAM-dependent methyltransferase [Desulfobotulus mexicanus]|nr:class I SAM-dependent methyltransferase [Desulfobotulus mexicanus]
MDSYFKRLYERTMDEAYSLAYKEIVDALKNGGKCLDCGANTGRSFEIISKSLLFEQKNYHGIDWSAAAVEQCKDKGLNVIYSDLNRKLDFEDGLFQCVFGLSVLEHLLNGCSFMKECYRILDKNGRLILLTPNISTLFSIALLAVGKMPSSGPHPDSNELLNNEEVFRVSSDSILADTEIDTPQHRHLVVFSFRVLKKYLTMVGFRDVKGYGFGLYPFPNFLQPILEKTDPYHCHQMVFIAKK